MSDLAEMALYYAGAGWPVLPLRPRAKLPHGRLVPHGLHDASLDPDVIRAWWTEAPAANIGLVTGVAFDAIDIDGPDGLASLMAADQGTGLVEGPQTVTGGGGWHLLQAVTGLGNRAGVLPKVDYRGKGGYIVAPPSMHVSGARYEWDLAPGLTLHPVPKWFLALLDPPRQEWTPPTVTSSRERQSAYARRALESEVGRVTMAPGGTRNDALNKAAFALGQLVAGGALDQHEVEGALLGAAHGVGLGMTESRRSIASGLRSGARHPRTVAVPV